MGFRSRDHPTRSETWGAKCVKCGEQTHVRFDPKKSDQPVMCRNCRDIYMP